MIKANLYLLKFCWHLCIFRTLSDSVAGDLSVGNVPVSATDSAPPTRIEYLNSFEIVECLQSEQTCTARTSSYDNNGRTKK